MLKWVASHQRTALRGTRQRKYFDLPQILRGFIVGQTVENQILAPQSM